MNPAANHCPLPKSAVWRFLSLYFHRNTSSNPLFPRNPHFPAYRSGHRLFQRPSPQKQFLSSPVWKGNSMKLKFWVYRNNLPLLALVVTATLGWIFYFGADLKFTVPLLGMILSLLYFFEKQRLEEIKLCYYSAPKSR